MDTMPLDCWLSAKNNINVEALQFQFLSILFMIERINIKKSIKRTEEMSESEIHSKLKNCHMMAG